MSQELVQRALAIFREACELSREERGALLDSSCGADTQLRRRVEAMLAWDEGAGAQQDDAALPQPMRAVLAGLAEQVHPEKGYPATTPATIGPYKLLEKIGEGGMGEIYAAEQQEPVVRRVALKIIKAGMDSAHVIARFEAERQALARMSHSNIAQIYDGGTTQDGRPYFVMEYVAGEPLNEYCDRRKLETRERLALFLAICEGVQHAHQKGVVHRDLKPSNLLVATQDGRAVPKVIDFGIARATTGRLAEHTLHTMLGQIVGTLEYMSPEQADPTSADVDTRSDIYSLGVVLYQLLCGLLPLEHQLRENTPLSEIQRAIREQDPPTPSTRLQRQTDTATTIALRHGTDERSLIRQLSGDLDWICMKALEKDPARRYQSASELAEDLRRHLAHEPVLAGRPGALYVARKFVRRHRFGAAAIAASALVATVGAIAFAVKAKQTSDARDQLAARNLEMTKINTTLGESNAALGVARSEAVANAEAENRARTVAEQRTADVLSLSAQTDLNELVAGAEKLWPAHPEMIPHFEAWLASARELIDGRPADAAQGLKKRPSLEEHKARLAELRNTAKPQTAEQAKAKRESHPKHAELLEKQSELTWRSRMLGLEAWPSEAAVEAEFSREALPTAANALNELAWPLVDPDKLVYGSEVRALLLARRAVAAATESERARIRDSLGWALFRLGRFNEALAEQKTALGEPGGDALMASAAQLEEAVASWRGAALSKRREQRDTLATAVSELDRLVSARQTYDFADPEARWWDGQLSKLVADLEELRDPKAGLMSDAISESFGWSVGKRYGFAKTIEERSVSGAQARQRWSEAIASIKSSPKYGGLELTPQMGLLPIGMDPDSSLWEFAHLETGAAAVRGAKGRLILTEEIGLVFVLIPSGTFWMGAQKTDENGQNYAPSAISDELPVHEVQLSAYFLSKYEMTQGQWERLTGRNPSGYQKGTYSSGWNQDRKGWSALHPVEQVTWTNCMALLDRVGCELPTEAQWECGARAGTTTAFWSGDETMTLEAVGNVADAYAKGHGGGGWPVNHAAWDDGQTSHAEVGSYLANAYGLQDVHGNVWEWCRDGYPDYSAEKRHDPVAPWVGSLDRVVRGGSFVYVATLARSASRYECTPEVQTNDIGLRPARAISP